MGEKEKFEKPPKPIHLYSEYTETSWMGLCGWVVDGFQKPLTLFHNGLLFLLLDWNGLPEEKNENFFKK